MESKLIDTLPHSRLLSYRLHMLGVVGGKYLIQVRIWENGPRPVSLFHTSTVDTVHTDPTFTRVTQYNHLLTTVGRKTCR